MAPKRPMRLSPLLPAALDLMITVGNRILSFFIRGEVEPLDDDPLGDHPVADWVRDGHERSQRQLEPMKWPPTLATLPEELPHLPVAMRSYALDVLWVRLDGIQVALDIPTASVARAFAVDESALRDWRMGLQEPGVEERAKLIAFGVWADLMRDRFFPPSRGAELEKQIALAKRWLDTSVRGLAGHTPRGLLETGHVSALSYYLLRAADDDLLLPS
jgi:hypothetical protein